MDTINVFPSVTIHVTVKNAEDTIKKCIDSLLDVDYPNKQIYVTEAYSSDRTYEILRQYGDKIKLERVIGNAPSAHNHIFKKINTDFIALTDADCAVDKNWLRNLVKAFTSNDIIAAGGYVKTPRDVNRLQKLIGKELENRFHRMPKFVPRLPTMNLCVRTEFAKKVRMNQALDVTFETEWGYRLTRFGKMIYVPNAVVYHYHRSDWVGFFKQQMKYAKYAIRIPSIYSRKIKLGDHISTPWMGIQLLLFILIFGTLFSSILLDVLFSITTTTLIFLALSLFAILNVVFLANILQFTRNPFEVLEYIILFLVRTVAWSVGMVLGILS